MKKSIITAFSFLMLVSVQAQNKVDRSKRPEAGPAPVISVGTPVTYKLPNGITVLVVEDHRLPKVSATYFIDQGPIKEGAKAGVFGIMGQMLEEGTSSKTKAQFDEDVDQMGANVNLSGSRATASALTRYFNKAFILMADALRHPAFNAESFEKIKSQTLTGLKSQEKNAKAISSRVVNALAYGKDHPTGEFETEESVTALTLGDIKSVYKQYVTPSRGYLTFVGDIKPLEAKALAEKALGDWKGTSLSLPRLALVNNPAKTEVDLIDVPNAVQSEITVVNLVNVPMSSPDYFPLLLANQILGGGAESRLFMNLRERHGYTYGAYSSVGAGRFQTKFGASASVRNEKADSAVIQMLSEIDTMQTQAVSDEELKNAKALYNGSFALGLEDPARTAAFSSNILINNLPADFYKTYLQKVNAVTAADIQRVAKKYFNYNNTRIVVVGKSEAVKTGLESIGYPVNAYDKFANKAIATNESATTVTAKAPQEIVADYIKAIGGEKAVAGVNSVLISGKMNIQGNELDYEQKEMSPNLQVTNVEMGGQTVMHRYFNGKKGATIQMGNSKDLGEDEVAEASEMKGIFPQLFYKDAGYKLDYDGVSKVGSKDAYKINITSPSGKKSTEYYDVASGYLVKNIRTRKANGQDIDQSIESDNYKKVGDIMFPFANTISVQTPAGAQEFSLDIDDIKLNSGVSAEDFK
ncbi:MAG: pitrilysin family protein [Ginsengibacter sp.]